MYITCFAKGWRSELPWTHCNPEFGTPNCFSKVDDEQCLETETYWNFKCTSIVEFCAAYGLGVSPTSTACWNITTGTENIDK